nr:MAG TPA: hypothetical protein [Bacteriophage sp.]
MCNNSIINIIKMSHKFTNLKSENEFNHGGKGKSTMKRKAKANTMTKKELKKFFGHSFPAMPKKAKVA